MNRATTIASLLVLFFIPSIGLAEDDLAESAEQVIVVPMEDVTSFDITGRSTLFRLTVSVASGGTIDSPKISGDNNVSLLRLATITTLGEDGELIGALTKEFVFCNTGAGTSVIVFTCSHPAQEDPTEYEFEVTVE